MKISYDWIRKYVPVKIRALKLADRLTMAGMEVTSAEKKGGDFIFDIEITSNRPDTLSHIGIAREVAAITNRELKIPAVKLKPYFTNKAIIPRIIIKDSRLCPRYTARIITGATIAPSPKWLVRKIESMGLRSVNNVVDITNFVMFETGQPLHAFDNDKLKGKTVIIRAAAKSESITTIDKVKRGLKEGTLVIADTEKPIAIAGIMGGLDTEVSASTKNILLEAADFNPLSIRMASRYLGIGTDSSYRFERGIDPAGIAPASDRAASLICEIAKAKAGKAFISIGKRAAAPATINLSAKKANALLGTGIPTADIKSILQSIGFIVSAGAADMLKVKVPPFRANDVKTEADLIEEIARLYGYDRIPTDLPKAIVTDENDIYKTQKRIINFIYSALSGTGFYNILTYSLVSEEEIKNAAAPELNIIPIKNPLSGEQAVMRTSLIPGALKAVRHNINRHNMNLKLFELSNIYFEQNKQLQEQMSLMLSVCGVTAGDWKQKPQVMDIFYLKGVLSAIFDGLGIDVAFGQLQHPSFAPEETIAAFAGNEILAVIGRANDRALSAMNIKTNVYLAEINMQVLFKNARMQKYFRPLDRYPGSERDISICMEKGVSFGEIHRAIKTVAGFNIKNINLVEEYKGPQIQKGQRALLLRITYQAKDKTLTEKEIETAHNAIREKLAKEFDAVLR